MSENVILLNTIDSSNIKPVVETIKFFSGGKEYNIDVKIAKNPSYDKITTNRIDLEKMNMMALKISMILTYVEDWGFQREKKDTNGNVVGSENLPITEESVKEVYSSLGRDFIDKIYEKIEKISLSEDSEDKKKGKKDLG
jgi:hypothetical protein